MPTILYFGSEPGDNIQLHRGHWPPENNTIPCYLVGPNTANIQLHHEFALALADELFQRQDCQAVLEGFAIDVQATVGRVLSAYDQAVNNR